MGRNRHDRTFAAAVAMVGLVVGIVFATTLNGCCSCDVKREAAAAAAVGAAGAAGESSIDPLATVPPPDQETDERFLAYHWYGDLPECAYVDLGRVDVPGSAGTEGLSAQQIERQAELDLGQAALANTANLPVGITRPDGVFGIQRSKGDIYVGIAFAFTDLDCRH
jgi:hypothetical protein